MALTLAGGFLEFGEQGALLVGEHEIFADHFGHGKK
jgi:hypothetical protein